MASKYFKKSKTSASLEITVADINPLVRVMVLNYGLLFRVTR